MRTETAPLVPIAMAAMDSTAGFPTGLDMAIAATKLLRELGGSAEPCRHLMSCEGQRLIPD